MAITSKFYTGPVNNVNWASGTRALGYRYMVRSIDDFKVTINGTVTRGFSVAPGVAAGGGVEDTNGAVMSDVSQTLPLNATDRWWLIGLRRIWGATKATTVSWVAGTSTEALPVRPETPGIEDFQPLALAFVPANGTAITILRDLRVVADNGGSMIAFSDLVRDYLNTPGTQLRVVQATGTVEWTRHYTTGLALTWSSVDVTPDTGWTAITTVLTAGWTSTLEGRRIGNRVELRGTIDPNGGNWGAVNTSWDVVVAMPLNFTPVNSRVYLLPSGIPGSAGIAFRVSVSSARAVTVRCSAASHTGAVYINVSYIVD